MTHDTNKEQKIYFEQLRINRLPVSYCYIKSGNRKLNRTLEHLISVAIFTAFATHLAPQKDVRRQTQRTS